MAQIKFRVTEVNDLSTDGHDNKRIVLMAQSTPYVGTGPVKDGTPGAFGEKATVSGRLELLVDNATQLAFFPLGTIFAIEVPKAEPKPAPDPILRDDWNAARRDVPGEIAYDTYRDTEARKAKAAPLPVPATPDPIITKPFVPKA